MLSKSYWPLLSAFIAVSLGACAQPYVEPTGVPVEQLALVSGPINQIDGLAVRRTDKVMVMPGPHSFLFRSNPLFQRDQGFMVFLDLHAGIEYEFKPEFYFDAARLLMHNVTTGRKTYVDTTRWVYYDESNKVMPRPQGAYAP